MTSPRNARTPFGVGSLLASLAVAAALTACGTKQDVVGPPAAKPFTLMLDFFPNADHAAIYQAISRGDLRRRRPRRPPRGPGGPLPAAQAARRREGRHGDLR